MKKIYMFSFESIFTKKVGGLAEVPPRLGKALSDLGYEVKIFTPNHGLIDVCRDPLFKTRVNDVEFCVSELPGVEPKHVIVGGGLLDDQVVYPPDRLLDKSLLFARVLMEYFGEIVKELGEYKVVFHGHDWHSAPVLLAVNKLSSEMNLNIDLVYHVHLSSKNRIDIELFCRYLRLCSDTRIRGDFGFVEFMKYYEESSGLIERLVALTVDKVITVSKGYSKSLLRVLGLDVEKKVGYIYNATPLTWSDVKDSLARKSGLLDPEKPPRRLEFRRRLLVDEIKYINLSWIEKDVEEFVKRILNQYGLIYNEPFKSDGPLVFAIGRLSKQKGFDLVVRALDKLTLRIPSMRVVLAPAPSRWDVDSVRILLETVLSYPDNLRVLPGFISKDDAIKFYYASNATLVPSRNEPFGLVTLESMATGTPVAASRVGGLPDIVLDVRVYGLNGVGVLFEIGNVDDMVESTSLLVDLMESGYRGREEPWVIRNSCITRTSDFNWEKSAQKIIEIYRLIDH